MARIDPPMVVVTTVSGDERAGCLVGFHCQAGMAPDKFAVWLSKANHTYAAASTAEHFAVHFLRRDQQALAALFGTNCSAEIDKFDECAWSPGPGGVPVLTDCADRVVGTKDSFVDSGTDHVCLIIDPVEAHVGDGEFLDALRLSDVVDLEPAHGAEEPPPADG